MKYTRFVAAAICGVVLLSVSACSDLTGVGSDVGAPLEGGDPESFEIVPDSIGTTTSPSETGFAAPARVPTNQRRTWRFLAGRVEDPLAGGIAAEGYVDLDSSNAIPESIQEADADTLEAELRLTTTYLHGDSTSTVDVELFDLVQEEEMGGAPADTTLETEMQAAAAGSVSPTDSLVTLSLPSSWIAEHQDVLLDPSANLEEDFHGLKIAPTSGNAVVGFNYGTAQLRIRTASRSDSVDYRLEKAFTHIEREDPGGSYADELEQGSQVLLDGVGIGLSVVWNDTLVSTSGDTLVASNEQNLPLNRAEITVPVDTAQTQASLGAAGVPASFVRPLPSGYRIQATRVTDSPQCSRFGLFSLSQTAQTCLVPTSPDWVPYAARASSEVAFTIFDYALSSSIPFSSFRAELAERDTQSPTEQQTARRGLPSTLPVVVRTEAPTGDTEALPRVTLVVTPL